MRGEDEALPLIVPGKDYNQPINFDNDTPLEYCLNWGKTKAALKFIEYGAAIDKQDKEGCTPLRRAAGRGDADIVRLLLKKGADPNDGGKGDYTPLDAAAHNNRLDIMQDLLAKGARFDRQGGGERTPLMWAASNDRGATEAMQLLLQKHAAIDTADKEGNTALTCAVMGQVEKSVQLLIDGGANLNLRNNQGETALYIACHYIRGAANAAQLLQAGADPNIADNDGITPLMWTAVGGLHQQTFEALLARGAQVDARDNGGATALIWAARKGLKDAVKKLLEAGADPCLATGGGQTARDYAAAVRLLNAEGHGADAAEIETMLKKSEGGRPPQLPSQAAPAPADTVQDGAALQHSVQVSHALHLKHRSP